MTADDEVPSLIAALTERVEALERQVGGWVKVTDVVTGASHELPATREVVACGPAYVDRVHAGDVLTDEGEAPEGEPRRLGQLRAGDVFAAWDGDGEPPGWWAFEVAGRAR